MNIFLLCEMIQIPEEIVPVLREKHRNTAELSSLIRRLTEPGQAEAAHRQLEQVLRDDMAMLACQLEAAALYYDRYLALGIPQEILTDTLKCFSRFLTETRAMTGKWIFDRDWWTWRQVSGQLFRIGQLEYEMVPGAAEISMHIPSDAEFTPENVDASLASAREFFARFFPEYRDASYVCHSWLLSPKLRELLGEGSNILAFQNRFSITHVAPDNRDFIGWLFQVDQTTPVEQLPERTGLQKKAKQLLLSGGNIGEAGGILL